MSLLRQRVEGIKNELAVQAGESPRSDGIKVGAVAAYSDLLNIEHEDVSQ